MLLTLIRIGASDSGLKVLLSLGSPKFPFRNIFYAWCAILCRDMPFAGLQIALFDIYKNVLSFLDEQGWSIFAQRALWGILAGSTAAFLTTPFDVLTTNVMTASDNLVPQEKKGNLLTDVGTLFKTSLLETINVNSTESSEIDEKRSGATVNRYNLFSLFAGAIPRVLFFGPAAMIFFASYESVFEIISEARDRHSLWF